MKNPMIAAFILFVSTLTTSQISYGQYNNVEFEDLDSLIKIEKRHVIIFIHTSWCKHCARMQETTLKNKDVVRELNKSFYFIKIDAEGTENITFRGHTFKYKPVNHIHELAEELGTKNGQVSFPTVTFLSPEFEIIYQHDGFLSSKSLLTVMRQLKEAKN